MAWLNSDLEMLHEEELHLGIVDLKAKKKKKLLKEKHNETKIVWEWRANEDNKTCHMPKYRWHTEMQARESKWKLQKQLAKEANDISSPGYVQERRSFNL